MNSKKGKNTIKTRTLPKLKAQVSVWLRQLFKASNLKIKPQRQNWFSVELTNEPTLTVVVAPLRADRFGRVVKGP